MGNELNRRDFLKGALVTGVCAAGVGLAGCSAPSQSGSAAAGGSAAPVSGGEEKKSYEISETIDTDIVVVGAGAAGCSAAVRAAQLGLKVDLLEIAAVVGGTTIFTEGMTSIHSRFHTPETDWDIEEMVKRIQDYHHWLSDGHIIRQMLEQSATNIDWLESIGHEFVGLGTMTGAKKLTWTMYKHEPNVPSGAGYVEHWGKLVSDTFKDNINVHFSTRGLQTELTDGKVSAVIAQDISSEKYTQFNCKAVVYATGGYSDNFDMFEEFVGFKEGEYLPMGMGNRTGDGIAMGRENKADLCRYPSCTMWYGGCLPGITYATELYCATAFQPMFWVNEKALRFVDEEYAEHNFSFAGNAQSAQHKVFSILTQGQMDSFVTEGTIFGCGDYIKPGSKLDGTPTGLSMWDEYKQQVDAGNKYIFKADTIEDLAKATGLDPVTLKTTIEQYNQYCANGVDGDFNKPAEYLRPLNQEDGPYYAFQLLPGVFTTAGGLQVNDTIQCVDEEGAPIIGMYAAGCDAGGLEGDSYDVGICEGSKQCWCAYSGKLAAEHLADTLFSKPAADEYANPVTWK